MADTKTQRDKAVADAKTQTKRADELSDKLTKTTQERDDAQAKLAAYQATGLTADQVGGLNKALKSTQNELEAVKEENGVLQRTVSRLTAQINELIGTNSMSSRCALICRAKSSPWIPSGILWC